MVLHHVAQGARCFVVTGQFLDSDGFRGSDLNAGDVIPIPDGFENRVGEPHHHDVLDRFLPEVVVDAKDLVLLTAALNHLVEGLGASVVPSKWFFNHNAAALGIFQQACIG